MKSASVAKKLSLSIALVVSVSLTILGLLVVTSSRKTLREQVLTANLTAAILAARAVEQYVAHATGIMREAAGRPSLSREIRDANWPEARKVLENFLPNFPQFDYVFVQDPQGVIRARVPYAETVGQDFSFREFFREAMRTRRWYLSGVYVSKAAQRPGVTIAVPVLDDQATVKGVLVGALSLHAMSQFISKVGPEGRGFMYVVDGRGLLVAHSEGVGADHLEDMGAQPIVQAVTAGKSGTVELHAPEGGEGVLGAYVPAPPLGWGVVAMQPASVAYAPAERLGGWFLLVALGSTAVAVLLGWGLARSFPRPVRHLGEPAEKKMTAGDFAVRVTPASQDEVGPPANSSHSIAEELQESHGEPDWTMEDHTRELEAAKARLEEALRRVEEASQHKSDFLAEMSHELRTPLNAIIGFSELLQGQQFGPLNEKQQRHVDNIWTSGKHLLQLINDILDLSKVEARKIELWPEPFSPRQALEAALNDIRPQAEAKGLRVDLQMDEGLSTIVADPVRFKQILYNLLSNAVKCTPDGGRVTVTAKWVHGSEFRVHRGKEASHEPSTMNHERPRDFLEFAVQDTGIGMKAEDLPKLFREFTQLDASLAKEHQGTGLGLALTKRLVELQGGKIRAESDGEGRGSTFTVILPIRPPRRARPRLLLVDDDVGVVQAIATALKQTGYTVETVADGQEALARVAQRPPDLLLLDVILPGLDGRDILAALRRREATRRLPVIAFTGVEGVGEKEVRALGADEFLTKPFSTTALLRMIGSFLDSGTWATTPDPPPSA